MSTAHLPSALFEEIARFFASAPTPEQIIEFRPSQAAMKRAAELLELNRENTLNEQTHEELGQYEQAELLLRLIKARVRANQSGGIPPR